MLGLADVGAEAVLIAGGGRAILLQIADPAIAAGVARHSDFAHRPLDRLNGTLMFVYALGFGTPEDRARVVTRVNRAHGPVRSAGRDSAEGASGDSLPGSTPAYSAFDPTLQLWVAATLYETATVLYSDVFGALDDESAEQIYREYAVLGTALQMPVELWPEDRAAFERYWDERMSSLTVTDDARRVAHDLLHPVAGPLLLRASMPLARLITAGLLDERLRREFGLDWSPLRQKRFDRVMAVIRAVWPRLPRRLRHWPARHYLRRLRAL